MNHLLGLGVLSLIAALPAQSTRTYVYDDDGNRTSSTNQVRFTTASGFSIEPRRVLVGDRFNIYGRNFPAGQTAAIAVTFGGAQANILSVSERVITGEVPMSVASGTVALALSGGSPQIIGDVTVQGVVVTPDRVELDYDQVHQFNAQVIGATSQNVDWSVDDVPGGNANVGTISPAGLYTAPSIATPERFPFLIRATSPELGISGFALVALSCASSAPIGNQSFVGDTLAASFERHCYDFAGTANRRAFVACIADGTVLSLTLRSSNGTLIAASGPGPTLAIPDVPLPLDDTYRIEIQGDGAAGVSYQLWVDQHDDLPDGRWLLPADGTWHTAAYWSNGVVPSIGDDVVIPDYPNVNTVSVAGGSHACRSLVSDEALLLQGGALTVTNNLQVNEAFTLNGGTLVGATVLPGAGGQQLTATSNAVNRLVDVTVTGELLLPSGSSRVRVVGGLRVGTLRLQSNGASVAFEGSQSIEQGTISFENDSGASYLEMHTAGTLTIESGVTIRGQRGRIGGSFWWGRQMNIINQGTIDADVAGQTLTIDGRGGTFTNFGDTRATGGVMTIAAATWTSPGTLSTVGGTLNLGGSFVAAGLGTLNTATGAVNVTGDFDLANGAFTLDAGTGSWRLNGGRIRNGTLTQTGGASLLVLSNANNRFDTVVVNGDLLLPNGSSRLRIAGDLTVNGTVRLLSNGASIGFEGDQTIHAGTISFEATAGTSYLEMRSAGTLTLEPGVTIRGQRGIVGGSFWWGQQMNLVNEGTISGDSPGGGLTIDGRGGTFTNAATGTIGATAGGSLAVVAASWTNEGMITSDASLALAGSWSNAASIVVSGGVANLGGTFTPVGLGTFTNNGAIINLTGVFDLQGGAFQLDGTTGSWNLIGGTIQNGTILQAGGAVLRALASGNNRIDTVVINGDLLLSSGSSRVRIAGNLTVNGTVRLQANGASLGFEGSQTIQLGTISFEAPSGTAYLEMQSPGTLTIAPGVSIVGGRGIVGGSFWWSQQMDIVNQGTIDADVGGQTLTIDGRGGALTNSGTVAASGGTLAVNSPSWASPGTLSANGGTLNLSGSFALGDLATLATAGGTVNILGNFDLQGGTFQLNAGTGSWRLNGGRVFNGTVDQTAGSSLIMLASSNNRLDSVTVNGDLLLPNGSSRVRIIGGLRVNGTVRLQANAASIAFDGTQTIHTGAVSFEAASGTAYVEMSVAGTLTIAPGVTISGGRGALGGGFWWARQMDIVNQGTIDATGAGTLTIDGRGGTFTNDGTAAATGGTLSLNAVSWTSPGTLSATGGTLNLSGAFGRSDLGTLATAAGTVNITGDFDLEGGTFQLDAATGSWNLSGGRVFNGTVDQTGGSSLLMTANGNNRLDSVTMTGDLLLPSGSSRVRISGGLRVNGTARLQANGASIGFEGTQTIHTGSISFEAPSGLAYLEMRIAGTLTIAPGVTISGGRGVIGGAFWWSQQMTIDNQGTIDASSAGTLTVDGRGGAFTNNGTAGTSGGTLAVNAASWTSPGTLTATAGTLSLGGSFTRTGLSTLATSGGTVNVVGDFDLENGTFPLDAATGSWNLVGGIVHDGTVDQTAGSSLIMTANGNNRLDAVTVNGDLLLPGGSSRVRISGGMRVNGVARLQASGAAIGFEGDQTIHAGTISFEAPSGLSYLEMRTAGALTIAPGVTITGGRGRVGGSFWWGQAMAIDNQGTVSLDSLGRIDGALTNQGTLRVGATGAATTLTIANSFTQTAAGTLEVDLGGLTAGSQFDQLVVTGAVSLAGTLAVSTIAPFVPATGNPFLVVSSNQPTGAFNAVAGFTVTYPVTGVLLTAQ